MHACGEQDSYHITRVAEFPTPWTPSGAEIPPQDARNYQGSTSTAHEYNVPSVADLGVTTLMLTDLPYTLTLADLRDEMAFLGFNDSYDYIFYPREKKQHFRGYCFVNFVSTAEAQRFAQVFVDHKFEFVPSSKLSNVQASRTQGLQENLAKIKPGSTGADNFFIDWARHQHTHGGNAYGGSGGWYGGYAAAEYNHSGSEAYNPDDRRYYGSRQASSRQMPHNVEYGSRQVSSCQMPYDAEYGSRQALSRQMPYNFEYESRQASSCQMSYNVEYGSRQASSRQMPYNVEYESRQASSCQMPYNAEYGSRQASSYQMPYNAEYGSRQASSCQMPYNAEYGSRQASSCQMPYNAERGSRQASSCQMPNNVEYGSRHASACQMPHNVEYGSRHASACQMPHNVEYGSRQASPCQMPYNVEYGPCQASSCEMPQNVEYR